MNSCRPAIENIRMKNISTMRASLSIGRALSREETMILSPWMLEIVLRGLMTLKDLRN